MKKSACRLQASRQVGRAKKRLAETDDINDECDKLLTDSEDEGEIEAPDGDSDIDIEDINELFAEEDNVKPKVFDKLANNVHVCFRKRIKKENRKELTNKYGRPENTKNLKVPKVKDILWDNTKHFSKKRDVQLSKLQSVKCKAAIPIIENAQAIHENKSKQLSWNDTKQLFKDSLNRCMDALLLVGDAFTDINQMRRDILRKGLPKSYKTMCHPSKEVSTNWLFGDDLSKQLKDISVARTLAKSLKTAEDEDQNIPKYNKYPTAHYGKQLQEWERRLQN